MHKKLFLINYNFTRVREIALAFFRIVQPNKNYCNISIVTIKNDNLKAEFEFEILILIVF